VVILLIRINLFRPEVELRHIERIRPECVQFRSRRWGPGHGPLVKAVGWSSLLHHCSPYIRGRDSAAHPNKQYYAFPIPFQRDRADGEVTETPGQVLLQANMSEQRLEHHQSGERGQLLIRKSDLGNTVGFTMDSGFATLHFNGLSWLSCWIFVYQFYQIRGRFFMEKNYFLASIFYTFLSSLWVKSSNTVVTPSRAFI
jgi:hypothetical protein